MLKFSRYIALFPLITGLLTLLGWTLGAEVLKRPLGGPIAMNPMTAVGLIFAAAAFLLWTDGRRLPKMIAPFFAISVGLVGVVKMVEFIGVPVHIDDCLFRTEIARELSMGQINRMAPNSAFNFILLSLAFMCGLIQRRYWRNLPIYFALVVLVVGIFSFIAFIFRVRDNYGVLSYLPMAVPSALSFVALALALLFRHADKSFMTVISSRNTGGRISRTLIPVAIFAPIVLGYIRLWVSWHMPLTVELGVAMLTTSIIIVFLSVVWFVSRALNGSDAARRKAEKELQRQAALFDLMPDAVIYGQRDLTITSMNKAAEDMFEVPARSAIGRKVDEIMKLEVMGMTREEARLELWGDKGLWKGEIVFTTLFGRKTHSILTMKAMRDKDGTRTGFIGIYSDVTEFKRAEQRMEFVMESMGAGLWEWTIATGARWWSPEYFALLGFRYNEVEPSGDTLRFLMHPDDVDHALATMRSYTTRKEAFSLEVRIRRKDGGYRWFMTVGKTKFDSNGKPVSVIGSITDIDDRVRARLLMEQQAVLIQTIPDGIVYASLDNKIISINSGAQDMLGITAEEAVGHSLDELFTLKIIGTTRDAARMEFAQQGYLRQEIEITNRMGEKVNVLATVRRYEQLTGQQPGWICIYTDISPLRLNDGLRAANRYLEQLAFIAAHDIKAPVQTLSGLTALLLKSQTLGENDRHILTMQNDVIVQMQRTNRGLNDILKLRQGLQSGALSGEKMQLRAIIEAVVATLQEKLDASQAELKIDLGDVAEMEFPFFYLQSVFLNLLSNAVKYRDPQRPLVIDVRARTIDRDTLSVTISDTGLGINMDRHGEKIFGMFKRFHPGIEGTGIGLNIVKSIIEAYGGAITVRSEVGKGTLFAITLKTP